MIKKTLTLTLYMGLILLGIPQLYANDASKLAEDTSIIFPLKLKETTDYKSLVSGNSVRLETAEDVKIKGKTLIKAGTPITAMVGGKGKILKRSDRSGIFVALIGFACVVIGAFITAWLQPKFSQRYRLKTKLAESYLAPFSQWCSTFYGELDEFNRRYVENTDYRGISGLQIITDYRELHEALRYATEWVGKIEKENKDVGASILNLMETVDIFWHNLEDNHSYELPTRKSVEDFQSYIKNLIRKHQRDAIANEITNHLNIERRQYCDAKVPDILGYLKKQIPRSPWSFLKNLFSTSRSTDSSFNKKGGKMEDEKYKIESYLHCISAQDSLLQNYRLLFIAIEAVFFGLAYALYQTSKADLLYFPSIFGLSFCGIWLFVCIHRACMIDRLKRELGQLLQGDSINLQSWFDLSYGEASTAECSIRNLKNLLGTFGMPLEKFVPRITFNFISPIVMGIIWLWIWHRLG